MTGVPRHRQQQAVHQLDAAAVVLEQRRQTPANPALIRIRGSIA